ncbi:MAG TPA: NAD(P)-dependent oxidoreductase [Stellaceae bacterium]|jgi:nucleoside-diphosphate-sugar epimerase
MDTTLTQRAGQERHVGLATLARGEGYPELAKSLGMKVLVTGGGGYKGVKIAESLLARGCEVTILDTFYFGYSPVLHVASHPRLTILRKDVREDLTTVLAGHDVVIHLAGLSGFPACVANPGVALAVNVEATAQLAKSLARDQLLIFASTTAMYEVAPQGEVDETTKVSPGGLYTKTKKEGENICLGEHANTISLRLATVMGVAPRMRNNLLVNEFVMRAVTERSLVLYDANAKRTFMHIDDCVRGYMLAIDEREKMRGGIYNVGSRQLNFSKQQIADAIKAQVPCDIINSKLADNDSRNFTVSFAKIEALGFECRIGLEETIRELVKLYRFYRPRASDEQLIF